MLGTLNHRLTRRLVAALIAAARLGATAASAAQRSFATPEAALQALVDALGAANEAALIEIFGTEHADVVTGGDGAAAREEWRRGYEAAQQVAALRPAGDGYMIIVLGRQAWPLPIPLVPDGGAWRFDTAAGAEEITNRRIGRNELAAIEVARAYINAQLDYSTEDRDGDQVLEYAQRLLSMPGQQDGLYWPASEDQTPSPFGPLIAEAQDYLAERAAGEPYRGYYFRVLTKQGLNPAGGAYDYVINGNMIAGFALIAWPAEYDRTGIMTFLVSHQGTLYQRDLGPDTGTLAAAIAAYDPDGEWAEVLD
jgi:hypothetical protein